MPLCVTSRCTALAFHFLEPSFRASLWPLAGFQRNLATEKVKDDIDSSFDDKQTETILTRLNYMSANELAQTELVTVSKAISLCRWRDTMGGFRKVSDMLKITGIGHTLAGRLCKKLLGDDTTEDELKFDEVSSRKPGVSGSLSGCIPRITVQRAQSILSFAALDIGQNQITWCSMTRDVTTPNSSLYVHDWNRAPFLETPFMVTKHSHATLHEKMVEVVYKHLPTNVDCYIAEFKRLRCPTLKFMPLIVNQTIAETVLLTLLNSQSYNAHSNLHKVFKMRPSAVTRLFGLSIGNERVSGHRVVESAIERRSQLENGTAQNSDNTPEQFSVDLSPNALARYRQVGEMERESFNIAFLLGVAFNELVLKAADKAVAGTTTAEDSSLENANCSSA